MRRPGHQGGDRPPEALLRRLRPRSPPARVPGTEALGTVPADWLVGTRPNSTAMSVLHAVASLLWSDWTPARPLRRPGRRGHRQRPGADGEDAPDGQVGQVPGGGRRGAGGLELA